MLYCLGQKYVKDRLDLTIVVKEIVIFNLSDFIDTGLFGNVWRSGWPRHKLISLALNLRFFRPARFVLLSQEVSEIDLNAGRRAGSEVVWRYLIFGFFELNKLGFDHFDLFLFPFGLNSQLLFLHGR